MNLFSPTTNKTVNNYGQAPAYPRAWLIIPGTFLQRLFFAYGPAKIRYWTLTSLTRRWSARLLLLVFGTLILLNYAPYLFQTDIAKLHVYTQHRDQVILYRIIGNDLPPRHKEGQTLSNLRFILEHEPQFPNTRKLFVLNRIADAANEATIINLLNKYQMEYLRIPFIEDDYKQIDFRLEDFPEPDFLHSNHYRRYSKMAKLRVLDYMYHDKNLYAINNNGGRNTALYHGRSISNARWIMPFDGNCYLSSRGFKEIMKQLNKHGSETKYFIVPMARLLNNTELLHIDERPSAPEEPQIIFRFDAMEEYNVNMRYGRRSKLELLWRLGALENRRLKPVVSWEQLERPYSRDKGNFRTVGWVFRLFSGNPQQEENKRQALSMRAFNRLLAVQSYLDRLDETITRRTFRQEKLFLYNEDAMAHWLYQFWSEEPKTVATVSQLQQQAKDILVSTCPFVTGSQEKENHHDVLSELSYNVTVLTLASYFLREETYGHCATRLIRRSLLEIRPTQQQGHQQEGEGKGFLFPINNQHMFDFLSDQGYAFPSLTGSPHRPKMQDYNVSDLARSDLSTLLDSVRLLRRMHMLTHKDYLDIQSIATTLVDFLVASPTGIHLAQLGDYRGTYYDLQIMALAAFTDDVRLLLRVINRCRMRIGKQLDGHGSQPWTSTSTNPEGTNINGISSSSLDHGTMNLLYWSMITQSIQNAGLGKDTWSYQAKNGAQIAHAVITHLKQHLPTATQREKLVPLAYLARAIFARHPTVAQEDQTWLSIHLADFSPVSHQTKPFTDMRIPPFWSLGIL
ncbi:hypothetical protein EC973_008168 [Apophysomyces ossiformis]|uniref:Alginate lyase domain-containing protein n=1 Tax=Apophysomyces ossiformis TaxID=679940 RepID=A0A8H7BX62_9FUNG|nr:hypothetical protein EC973_008168 [Apophysomyces ossiformis]